MAAVPDDLQNAAAYIYNYPAFPTLWVPHCIVMAMGLRQSLGEKEWRQFSRRHPLACLLLATLYIFPGALVSAAVLGQPMLAFLLNTPMVVTAFASWYLVFYCPGDLAVTVINAFYLIVPFGAMQELLRLQLVRSGVLDTAALHPGALLYPAVMGITKSCGFVVIKYLEQLISGFKPSPLAVPNSSTKTILLAAAALAAHASGHLKQVDGEILFAGLSVLAASCRVIQSTFGVDIYLPVQKLFCAIIFGSAEESPRKTPSTKV